MHILFSQYGVQKKIIIFPKNKKRKHQTHTRGLLTSAFICIPTHSQCSFYLLMTSYQMCLSSSCKLLHASSYKTSCASPEIPHICHFIMDSIIGIPAEGYDEGGARPYSQTRYIVTLNNHDQCTSTDSYGSLLSYNSKHNITKGAILVDGHET